MKAENEVKLERTEMSDQIDMWFMSGVQPRF